MSNQFIVSQNLVSPVENERWSGEVVPLKFDPTSPDVISDPYPYYDKFRSLAPVFKTHFDVWFLTRHADVTRVLRDRRLGKNFAKGRTTQSLSEPVHVAMRHMMIYLNPPEHTRIRGLVTQAFSMKKIEEMRPRIAKIAEQLLDRVEARKHMDVVADFAFPLPLAVIADILGIPEENRADFFERLPPGGRALDVAPMSRREMDDANARVRYLESFFLPLLESRRQKPMDDLLTHLAQAQESNEGLSERELISNVILLFGAGHETTTNAISNALVALFRHPDELRKVIASANAIRAGVDELLRYDASVQFAARAALEDVDIDGVSVKEGEIVIASLGAANRDPAAYVDPNRLDLFRQDVRPLSFGGGIHFCLGAQLARIELEVALQTLFRRFPRLHVDVQNITWKPSFIFRGPARLNATW